ncbi:tubulin-specific chaperone A isoform X2 [Apteryx rowi]|uniref:tubulin-specific chaperone A isoform X2 n=1 Tax=Apteryx rowi TaxID=308060 RepID=UPI000E1DC811|nr:tubulin-specific chaperone A isoform X2 [Apteryx rowi]
MPCSEGEQKGRKWEPNSFNLCILKHKKGLKTPLRLELHGGLHQFKQELLHHSSDLEGCFGLNLALCDPAYRLAKEKVMYEKEAKQQEEKIEKMKAEACDDYGIKKQKKKKSGLDFSGLCLFCFQFWQRYFSRLRSCKNHE